MKRKFLPMRSSGKARRLISMSFQRQRDVEHLLMSLSAQNTSDSDMMQSIVTRVMVTCENNSREIHVLREQVARLERRLQQSVKGF